MVPDTLVCTRRRQRCAPASLLTKANLTQTRDIRVRGGTRRPAGKERLRLRDLRLGERFSNRTPEAQETEAEVDNMKWVTMKS